MATTQHPLDELYDFLGQAMADVMEHPDVPDKVFNELGEMAVNLTNLPLGRGVRLSAIHARTYMPECLKLFTAEMSEDDEPDDEPEAA